MLGMNGNISKLVLHASLVTLPTEDSTERHVIDTDCWIAVVDTIIHLDLMEL